MDLWAGIEHDVKYKTKEKLTKKVSNELITCAKKLDKIDNQLNKIYVQSLNCNEINI